MKTAIIYDKWLSGMGGGEVVACNMARVLKSEGYRVILACGNIIPPQTIKAKLGIDVSDIDFKEVSNEQELKLIANNYKLPTINLFINISFMDYSYGIGERNIYYVHFPSKIRSGLFNYVLQLLSIIKKNFPIPYSLGPKSFQERIDDRLRAGIYPDMKKRLDSYDTFITHSKYVEKWVKKLWNKDAIVLYPPVRLFSSSNVTRYTLHAKRANWITSIGRFFTLGHGKKQEIMIEAFKQLFNSLIREPVNSLTDLQLHLIGGVGSEPSSIRFVEKLKQMAKGYPIYFHFNASRNEVEEILCKSKIYWHAAGYGEDAEHDPIKFEHFGIAPIEAISADCLPVLFDGGGLPEILEILYTSKDKYLFKTIEELVMKTQSLMFEKNISTSQSLQKGKLELFSHNRFTEEFCRSVA